MSDRPQAHLELQDATVLTGKKLMYRVVNDGDVQLGYTTGPVNVERWSAGHWTTVASPGGWWVPLGPSIEPRMAGPWMTLEVPRNGAAGEHRLIKKVHAAHDQHGDQPSVDLTLEFTVLEDPARI